MNNPRISKKEAGLLKGAVRRVFSRSELRQRVVARSRIEHSDPTRPRVKKWSRCEACKQPVATYEGAVDHVLPLVPLDSSLEEMSWDDLINRCWCDEKNLQFLDPLCHYEKTQSENKARREHKKGKKR